jgi:hypothetical protein
MLAWEPCACNEAVFRSSSAIRYVREDSERTKSESHEKVVPYRQRGRLIGPEVI